MLFRRPTILTVISALTLAALACNTITSLPQRLATPTPIPTPILNAAATPSGQDSADVTPQTIGDGPTVGTPREARVARADSAPGLEDLAAEKYTTDQMNTIGARLTYTLKVDQADTQVLWGYGWCASTRPILEQNLATMQLAFAVNGQAIDAAHFDVADSRSADGLECRTYLAVVHGWPSGQTTLETKITFTQAINDGIGDYPAGDQVFTYTVTAP